MLRYESRGFPGPLIRGKRFAVRLHLSGHQLSYVLICKVIIHIGPGSIPPPIQWFSAFPFHKNKVDILERPGNFFMGALYFHGKHIQSLHA